MGLLSSNFLRDVAIGAGEAYLDKRKAARDNVVEFQTRALNMKEQLEKKYQESFKERKKVAEDFKYVATQVGESYLPQLNSFMNQGGELQQFNNMDATQVKSFLDADRYKEKQDEFLPTIAEKNKLKAEDLNKQLQDRLNIFDNTASVFTKDIVTKGMEGIRTDVGTIGSQDIDTRVAVGPGVQTSTQPTVSDITKSKQAYNKEITIENEGMPDEKIIKSATNEEVDKIITKNKLAGEISGNVLNDDLYLHNAVQSYGNPNYSDAVTENYQIAFDALMKEYNDSKDVGNTNQMQSVADTMGALGFEKKQKELEAEVNKIKLEAEANADDMQEDQGITADTTLTIDNVGARPDDPVKGKKWDRQYAGKYDPETGDRLTKEEPKESKKGIPFNVNLGN
jgi:hypothetical protein